jgi:hypothetical protein
MEKDAIEVYVHLSGFELFPGNQCPKEHPGTPDDRSCF